MQPQAHSFLTPATRPSGPPSARELAEESKAALVDLEGVLKQRNQVLEQQIQEHEREKTSLRREKEALEHKLQSERHSFADKREQLWSEIDRGKAALQRKTNECDAERQRADQLQRKVEKEEVQLADTRRRFMLEAEASHQELRRSVERLKKQLQEQSAAFEQERARWQLGAATSRRKVETGLRASLERTMPHLRSLLAAFDRDERAADADLQPDAAKDQVQTAVALDQSDLVQRLRERRNEFSQERAQLLSDTARTQLDISRRSLAERETVLTSFDDPVVTKCCGKTFSSEALRRALRQSSQCPFCRASRVSFCADCDVAKLVELHREERSIVGLPELPASSPVAHSIEARPRASAGRTNHSRSLSTARQSRHREQRSERVHERSGVPHR